MKTKQTPQPATDLHIRWMIRRDFPAVLAIEAGSFGYAWSEEDFIRCLRNRNVIGMVVEHEERVVGFMIYELNKTDLHILNFAVHEDCRYRGVGAAMIAKLVSKLSHDRRFFLKTLIRETNLDAQLFFRAVGFRCVETHREYEINGEDAYEFRYRLGDSRCTEK